MAVEPPRAGTTEPFPDDLDPRVASALVARGSRRSTAPGGGLGSAARRRQRDRDDEHRERQEPRLQPAGARPARSRAEEPGALPLPDEGARAGPGAGALGLRRQGRQAGDLRRRHRERAPLADPQMGERDPDQPGHAPRRRPAAPRPLGRHAREPPLRRRRRGARLSRCLRLARRQRPPPPTPARPCVRLGASVRARIGDDREPGAARRVAARRAGRRDRQRRCACDRADDRALEPGADRRRAGRPRQRPRRRVAPARRLRLGGPADDLLREEPQDRRADPPLRLLPPRARARCPAGSVPRRLHADAATRDRAAA